MAELIKSRLSEQTKTKVLSFLRRKYAELKMAAQNIEDKEMLVSSLRECKKALYLINDIDTGMYDYGTCIKCDREIAIGRLITHVFGRACNHCVNEMVPEKSSKNATILFLKEEKEILKADLAKRRERVKSALKDSPQEITSGKDLGEINIHPKISLAVLAQCEAEIAMAEELIIEVEAGKREYGVCDCGEKIPLSRLLSRTFTKSCVNCLKEIEQRSTLKIPGGRKRPFAVTATVLGA